MNCLVCISFALENVVGGWAGGQKQKSSNFLKKNLYIASRLPNAFC